MKRISILMIALLLGVASLWARPGYSKPVDVSQPDGSTVTLLMHGDEFLSFMTTIDGYTVIQGEDGYYRYADKTAEGCLAATSVIARNPEARSASDKAFLAARQKMVAPKMTQAQRELRETASNLYITSTGSKVPSRLVTIWPRIDYNNFKGLVVLVNFSDRQFTMDDPQEFYQKLTSEANYTDASLTHYPVTVEGSARDYFRDNSMGIFDPTFDVLGPVQINKTAASVGGSNASHNTLASMFKQALNALNPDVDFSQYDMNNDGYIDIVYFIFAGYGSYVQGNNAGYLWPHANDWSVGGYSSWVGMPSYDGKKFGRYACSVEIQDYEAQAAAHQYLDGIGTICHEFSHVLGLADHYDTDYEDNGQSDDPGQWDIMADGADFNYGLTPVGYNAFERHLLGFVEPVELSDGSYSLSNFATDNEAFILRTGTTNDDFYVENRQKTGWDRFLPGHGLLVWRAETTNTSVWKNNKVNANASHNYFVMVSNPTGEGLRDLTSTSTPALKSWAGKPAVVDLYDILEDGGVVTFTAGKDLFDTVIEDFEASPLSESGSIGVMGKYCLWDLENAAIMDKDGGHVVELKRSGLLTSSVFEKGIRSLIFTIKNGAKQIRFNLRISTDGGSSWVNFTSPENIKKNVEKTYYLYDFPAGCKIQFVAQSTDASAISYLDDIAATFYDNEIPTPPVTGIGATLSDDGTVKNVIYDLSGRQLNSMPSKPGIYIMNGKKIIVK